jgi:class 3 adenylate cyclase
VSHIISFWGYGKACSSPTYEHMLSLDQRRSYLTKWADDWGKGGGLALRTLAPALAEEEAMRRVFARIERFSSSPRAIRSYFEINFGIDVLEVLPSVQVPTLVLARDDDNQVPSSAGRHLADSISNARYFDAGAGGHLYWAGDIDGGLAEIREFLTGEHIGELSTNRVLATVLFTDIVDSTDRLHKLGDGVWRDLLDRHDQVCSEIVELNRGRFIQSTGDGILATFDGPGRGVDCGLQLSERLNKIGLPIRAGLHIGEIELRNDNIAGASVHIAARIQSLADEGEVFVSRTVADLMVGNTGIHFESKGLHALKGFPGEWDILQAHG